MKKDKKTHGCLPVFIIFTVCVIIVAVSYNHMYGGNLTDLLKKFDFNFSFDSNSSSTNSTDSDSTDLSDLENKEYLFYYKQLNQEEANGYNELLKTVKKGESKCTLTLSDEDAFYEASKIIAAFGNDHPEFFWLTGGYSVATKTFSDNHEIELFIEDYWTYSTEKNSALLELQKSIDNVAKKASSCSTNYEKAKFVHDYLVDHTEYDFDNLEEAEKTVHDAKCKLIFSPYGCLVNGKAVCAGYAKAYQMVMNRLGINCAYITGYAGGAHAWNLVQLDNNYYVDVTWDDSDSSDDYKYFCVSTKEMNKSHVLDTRYFTYPDCPKSIH